MTQCLCSLSPKQPDATGLVPYLYLSPGEILSLRGLVPQGRRETAVDDRVWDGDRIVGEAIMLVVHLRDPLLRPLDVRR